MTRFQDAVGVLRGLQLIAEAAAREQSNLCGRIWYNSSVRESLEVSIKQSTDCITKIGKNPAEELKNLNHIFQESQERFSVVAEGFRQLALVKFGAELPKMSQEQQQFQQVPTTVKVRREQEGDVKDGLTFGNVDAANLDMSTITLKELEDILSKRNKNREFSLRTKATESKQISSESVAKDEKTSKKLEKSFSKYDVNPPKSPSPELLKSDSTLVENMLKLAVAGSPIDDQEKTFNEGEKIVLPKLSNVAKQRSVPASRVGRMASFGSLFAGLGVGTISELTKGALGFGGSKNIKEALWSPANTERIVDTLCRVRGAALKIGQILSIQDTSVVSPQLAKAFERVRQAADYMPDRQVETVMSRELGSDWRDMLKSFEKKPFAAASIGQVHRATLKNGMQVAIKIQYPGVAKSIESDIDNLVSVLKIWDVFPSGMFIDNIVKVAKRELNWEVDYTREAEYTEKFKEMLTPYPEYYIPSVVKDLTTGSVLTTELVPGVPLDKCFDMSYEHRQRIAMLVMKLILRELFEFQCMQTDPNWSNFLYDDVSGRLMLIDFGSARFFNKKFINMYRDIIIHAVNNNRQGVLDTSLEMGFLTGYESKQMEEAHVDAVMIMGEIFSYDGEFDMGKQNITERVVHLVPTMVAHRLVPPPEEIYSIHRKLSGIFLLCARLNVKLNCRAFYDDIIIKKFKT